MHSDSMLCPYDKTKVTYCKSFFPFVIILHHLAKLGIGNQGFMCAIDTLIIPFFFAMSGFGLVVSFANNHGYLQGFVKKSLLKLYIPYLIMLFVFGIYRFFHDESFFDVLSRDGICGLVPASWYIFVLSLFYIFFYIVFRYLNSTIYVKVFSVCALVLVYYFVAKYIADVRFYRYTTSPAFCAGMLFACFDNYIRLHLKKWLSVILILVLFVVGRKVNVISPICYSTCLFLTMYLVKSLPQSKIVNFLSKISLDMYIVQYIPIFLVLNDFAIKNPCIAIPLVLILDIAIALIVNLLNKKIIAKLNR